MLKKILKRKKSPALSCLMALAWLIPGPAFSQAAKLSNSQNADITYNLKVPKPPSSAPELRPFTAASALNLAIGLNELKTVYDNSAFSACGPGSSTYGFAANDWGQAPAYCLEIARQSYASSAARESFKEGVFGISEHPALRSRPDSLVKGLPDRVFLQSAQYFAASNSNSILTAMLAGKLEFSIPLKFSINKSNDALLEKEPAKAKYVVVYGDGGSKKLGAADNSSVRRPVLLASAGEDLGLSHFEWSKPQAEPLRSDFLQNRRSKKLVEVVDETQVVVSEGAEKAAPRKGGIAYYLGLESAAFSGFNGKLDRDGANRPQDVKFALFESSASLLFFEMKPFAEQNREQTVSYGYVLPYYMSRLRVQYFVNDPSKVYTAVLRSGVQQVSLTLEEKTEKLKLELNLTL